ncbi:MAG: hypothetical protein LBI57_05085 [Helicobacteraceae bacterium]|nr:hypothetical protein [Helicobacteraceae bacterium]
MPQPPRPPPRGPPPPPGGGGGANYDVLALQGYYDHGKDLDYYFEHYGFK